MTTLHHNAKDISGQIFGRLTALEPVGSKARIVQWRCRCSCGKSVVIDGSSLRLGKTRSCGCLFLEGNNRKHGMSSHRLHQYWCNMLRRGRKVCREWLSFPEFFEWAVNNGWSEGLSLDRLDNRKGYSPDNCRWTTTLQQVLNRRVTVWVEVRGERMCMAHAADKLGLPRHVPVMRRRNGWPESRWFEPVQRRR